MNIEEFIGYAILNTTAITAYVGSAVASYVLPETSNYALPYIGFYQSGPGERNNGEASDIFTIDSIALTKEQARDIGNQVELLFGGVNAKGIFGDLNNFTIDRCSIIANHGIFYDSAMGCYKNPVEIKLVYPMNTVS